MPPFFTIYGHPQTTNKQNKFSLMVVEASEISSMKDDNVVLFNGLIDGVSCEVNFNNNITIYYLLGKKKYLSLPNTHHSMNNCRDKMVSGASAASIGQFLVDMWMLKMANVAKQIYRVEYWASDSVCVAFGFTKNPIKPD